MLPFPSPGHLPNPGIKSESPALQIDSLLSGHRGSPDPREVHKYGVFVCFSLCTSLVSVKIVLDQVIKRDIWGGGGDERLPPLSCLWPPTTVSACHQKSPGPPATVERGPASHQEAWGLTPEADRAQMSTSPSVGSRQVRTWLW